MTIVKKKNPPVLIKWSKGQLMNVQMKIGILSSKSFAIPREGTRISYKIRGNNFYNKAIILGRAGKATGKNKHRINIEGSDKSLNEEFGFGAS